MPDTFTAEGYLNLESQEGGFAAPAWVLDKRYLDMAVVEHFGLRRVKWDDAVDWLEAPYVPGDVPVGRVRIVIERLPDA